MFKEIQTMAQLSQREFTHTWVQTLIESLDAHLDQQTKIQVIESCGRMCARGGPAQAAQEHRGDLDGWLTIMRGWHGGEEFVQRDSDVVTVLCSECVCPLVKDGPARLPDTFCYCSLGWMKEVFGTVAEKSIEIDLVDSVKRGGQECRFVIQL
jgi:hypothetical protein